MMSHTTLKQTCEKCNHQEIFKHYPGDPWLLWSFYCIKCLEKFLDDNIGKMKTEEIVNG
jgi:hypothetical protein